MTTKTIKMPYEALEDALVPYLIASGYLADDDAIDYILDFDVPLNAEGLVEFDIIADQMIPEDNVDQVYVWDQEQTSEMKTKGVWS